MVIVFIVVSCSQNFGKGETEKDYDIGSKNPDLNS
jgi:hypothetical protein